MSNLAKCLKSTGVKLSGVKKRELLSSYNDLKKLGMDHKGASVKVINDISKSLRAEMAVVKDVVIKAKSKAAAVPPKVDANAGARVQLVEDTVNRVIAKATKKILPTKVLNTPSQMPSEETKRFSKDELNDQTVRGYKTTDGTVYLFADRIGSAEEAIAVWMHEHIGHEGLKSFSERYGIDYNHLMKSVYNSIKNTKPFKAMAKAYAPETKDMSSNGKIIYLAEEFMAHRAERLQPAQRKNVWNKIRDIINDWLSSVYTGFANAPRFNMAQIDTILEASKSHYLYGEVRQFFEFSKTYKYYLDLAKRANKEQPLAVQWYDAHQADIKKIFGDDADIFNVLLAITSPNAKLEQNIMWALQTYMYMHGKRAKPGGIFWPNTEKKVKGMTEGDWGTVEGELVKVPEFIRGLLGDPNATTNDLWMRFLFFGEVLLSVRSSTNKEVQAGDKSRFTTAENTASRDIQTKLAIQLTKETDMEWTPKMVQAALWVGVSGRLENIDVAMDFAEAMNTKVKEDTDFKGAGGKTPLEWLKEGMGNVPIGNLHQRVKIPEMAPLSKLFKMHRNELMKRKLPVPVTANTTRIASKTAFKQALLDNDFAILSAEKNTNSITKNLAATKKLITALKKMNAEFTPMDGMYGAPENSFIIFNMTQDSAMRLGRTYNQESVIHNGDLIYQDGSYQKGDVKRTKFDQGAEDFYSVVNINGTDVKFQIPLDDDRVIDVVHFSSKDYLKRIDPRFQGTGKAGAEMKRAGNKGELKKSNWYVPKDNMGMEPHLFEGLPVYETQVKVDDLYEVSPNEKQPSDVELKNRGYDGWYEPTVGQVRLFSARKAVLLGKGSKSIKKYPLLPHPDVMKLGMQPGEAKFQYIERLKNLREETTDAKLKKQITDALVPLEEKGRLSKKVDWKDEIEDPEVRKVFKGVGYKAEAPPIDTGKRAERSWVDKLIVYMADTTHSLRLIESADLEAALSGWKAHKMLTSFPTMFQEMLENSMPVFDKEDLWIKGDNSGGLLTPFREFESEVEMEQFLHRFLAKSAREMQKKGREDLFGEELEDDATIQILLDHTEPEYLANQERWDNIEKRLGEMNTKILDFLQEAGMIDEKVRKGYTDEDGVKHEGWEREFYLPFTRIIEDLTDENGMKALYQNAGGKDVKQVIRRLSGGKAGLGDPLQNLINNYSFMIHEGLYNIARKKSLGIMMDSGLANKTHAKAGGNDVFKVYVKGKAHKIKVTDPELAFSLSDLHAMTGGMISKIVTKPKKWLTTAVTIVPAFRVANFVRDTLHTTMIEKSFMPLIDSIRGLRHAWMDTDLAKEFKMTGAAFSGSYSVRDVSLKDRRGAKAVRKQIKGKSAWNPIKILDLWEKVGEVSENAARIGAYSKLREGGESKIEAGFRAKDLLDFNQSGRGAMMVWLTRTVPFLNARVQGLYKIGTTLADPQARNNLIIRGLMMTAAATLVHMWNADDPEYKEMLEYERLQYINFMNVPGIGHVRLPLPFELGALFGSLPIFFGQYAAGSKDAKDLYGAISATIMDTLAFNPIPQAIKPLIQQVSNKNFFTGAPIESERDKAVVATERWNSRTSKLARGLSKALTYKRWSGKYGGEYFSPKRIDQLIYDYFSTTGRIAVHIVDQAIEHMVSYPDDPATRVGDRYMTGVGRFVKGKDPAYRTKSEEVFYEMLKASDELNSTVSRLKQAHRGKDVREMYRDRDTKIKLSQYKSLRLKQQFISKIGKRMENIALDTDMSPATKRLRLNKLIEKRNRVFHRTVKVLKRREK